LPGRLPVLAGARRRRPPPLCVRRAAGLLRSMPTAAGAQQIPAAAAAERAFADKQGKELHALRLAGSPPKIDGHLDDEPWKLAEAIDDFVQVDPDNMTAPTERTTVQVAYDDRYIYVALHCFFRD